MYLLGGIFLIIGLLLAVLSLIVVVLNLKSQLIFGKYPCKGLFYNLKYALALFILRHLRNKFYNGGGGDDGCLDAAKRTTATLMEKLDRPQTLTDDPKSYDVVSFMAANKQGEKLMITLERRRRGVLKAALYFWSPDEGLLCSPQLPDMVYFTSAHGEESKNNEFRGAGFHIYPEQCMRVWRLRYAGDLRCTRSGQLLPVRLDMRFSSTAAHFNYNRDLSSAVIADSVAREAWNERFYGLLKSLDSILAKRTHYEQSGTLSGELKYGEKSLQLELCGFRDHSFGTERCLSSINRYVYFALFLDDGTSMVIGNLSQPSFFLSSLKVGYVCSSSNGVYAPITRCNFELYSYGEKGTPPQHQNFLVQTAAQTYLVQIKVEDSAIRYVGGDWESKVYNQFVSCTVNGCTGQGIAEYLYRNTSGRPASVSCKDPEWYQRIKRFERSLSNMPKKISDVDDADADDELGDEENEFFF